jgi:hypothetical protein
MNDICPKCNKKMTFNCHIDKTTSYCKYECDCGYTRKYDPLKQDFRNFTSSLHEITRPTPVLKGASANKFYSEINNGKISPEQQKFLDSCVKFHTEHFEENKLTNYGLIIKEHLLTKYITIAKHGTNIKQLRKEAEGRENYHFRIIKIRR